MHANSPGASTEGTPEENEKRKERRKELTWDGGWGEKSGLAAEDIRGREASVGWCRWFLFALENREQNRRDVQPTQE